MSDDRQTANGPDLTAGRRHAERWAAIEIDGSLERHDCSVR
jgi:hypothetical protein